MNNITRSWNNRQIRIREDRYVCLTDMAQACGKEFSAWKRLDSSKAYIERLASVLHLSQDALIDSKVGGLPEEQGTYGHPKLSIRFAQWCSEDFAVQIDCWIDELLTNGVITAIKPVTPAEMLLLYAEQLVRIEKEQELLKKQLSLEAEKTQRLEEIIEHHDSELDRIFHPDGNYFSIRAYAKITGMKTLSLTEANRLGRKASKLSKSRNVTVDKLPDPRYGEVNAYSENILKDIFAS